MCSWDDDIRGAKWVSRLRTKGVQSGRLIGVQGVYRGGCKVVVELVHLGRAVCQVLACLGVCIWGA
jgi:hypothetical protein